MQILEPSNALSRRSVGLWGWLTPLVFVKSVFIFPQSFNYRCLRNGRLIARRDNLITHIRTHTRERTKVVESDHHSVLSGESNSPLIIKLSNLSTHSIVD